MLGTLLTTLVIRATSLIVRPNLWKYFLIYTQEKFPLETADTFLALRIHLFHKISLA